MMANQKLSNPNNRAQSKVRHYLLGKSSSKQNLPASENEVTQPQLPTTAKSVEFTKGSLIRKARSPSARREKPLSTSSVLNKSTEGLKRSSSKTDVRHSAIHHPPQKSTRRSSAESPMREVMEPTPAEANPSLDPGAEFEKIYKKVSEQSNDLITYSDILAKSKDSNTEKTESNLEYLQDLRNNIHRFYKNIQENINSIEDKPNKLNSSRNKDIPSSGTIKAKDLLAGKTGAASSKSHGQIKTKQPIQSKPKTAANTNTSKMPSTGQSFKPSTKDKKAVEPKKTNPSKVQGGWNPNNGIHPNGFVNEQDAVKYVNDLIERFRALNNIKSPKVK